MELGLQTSVLVTSHISKIDGATSMRRDIHVEAGWFGRPAALIGYMPAGFCMKFDPRGGTQVVQTVENEYLTKNYHTS